jgi:hypothetical protein
VATGAMHALAAGAPAQGRTHSPDRVRISRKKSNSDTTTIGTATNFATLKDPDQDHALQFSASLSVCRGI